MGLAVIGAEFYGDYIGLKFEHILECLFVHVGIVAFIEQHPAAESEVAYVVAFAEPLRQYSGITVLKTIFYSGAEGDTIADTGYFYRGCFCCHPTQKSHTQQPKSDKSFFAHESYKIISQRYKKDGLVEN